jgi:hypothetical protein
MHNNTLLFCHTVCVTEFDGVNNWADLRLVEFYTLKTIITYYIFWFQGAIFPVDYRLRWFTLFMYFHCAIYVCGETEIMLVYSQFVPLLIYHKF